MRHMLRKGDLVRMNKGDIGMVLTYFDPITYQPAMAEIIMNKEITIIPCNQLMRIEEDISWINNKKKKYDK